MGNAPYIHLFKTSEAFYLYDVNTDKIVGLPEGVYKELREGSTSSDNCEKVEAYVTRLKENGYLKSNRVEVVEHPSTEQLPCILRSKINQIVLQVTQRCNLRCEYCVYSGEYKNRQHTQKDMPWEVAKNAIDMLEKHSRDSDDLHISFYGGEPFLRFDFMKKCVEYSLNLIGGKKVVFNLTTNGTLLTDEIIDYIALNDFSVMISLDGPKEVHDRHRKFAFSEKGSYDIVMQNVQRIKEKYPDYYNKRVTFNIIIGIDDGFSCVNEFFGGEEIFTDSQYHMSAMAKEYRDEIITASDSFVEESEYEFFKLLLAKVNKIDKKYVSALLAARYDDMVKKRILTYNYCETIPQKYHHSGPCCPGAKRVFVNANGIIYPCERVSETSIVTRMGNVFTGIDEKAACDILNVEKHSHELCRDCWAYRYCSTCIKSIDGIDGYSISELRRHCTTTKFSVQALFQDYCVLRELGYNFFGERCSGIYSDYKPIEEAK